MPSTSAHHHSRSSHTPAPRAATQPHPKNPTQHKIPAPRRLSTNHGLNAPYANTYVFEDAYLSALVAGLADDELTNLPNTQAAQRAAIIRWRIGLTVLARAADAPLRADLQQAGRGEIAPSPNGR